MENSFNANLKKIRKEKGITQEQLAEHIGISPQAVSKWEMSSYPDPQLLPRIADYRLIPFLTFTHTLLKRPNSFNYQTNSREKPFFKNDTYKERKDAEEK